MAFGFVGDSAEPAGTLLYFRSLIELRWRQVRKTQEGFCIIRVCVWWTTIAISAVAAWFEWQYRRNRRRQSEEEPEAKPPVSEKAELPQQERLLSGSD